MTDDGIAALKRLAAELKVSVGTLGQYADGAGSYTIRQSHQTPHRRKLPPRGSPEGIRLADRIKRETGTNSVRTLAVRARKAD